MSIEHDISYLWSSPGGTPFPPLKRQIIGAVEGALDTQIPNNGANVPAAFALTLAKVLSIYLMVDQAVTLRAGGVNAVQSLVATGATAGSFTETYAGQTATVPWNATAAQVVTLLTALSTVGANGCTATGGPLPATPVVVTFTGLLGLQVLALPTVNNAGLTGGTAVVTTTTAGVAPDTTINLLAKVPLVFDSSAYYAMPFNANITTLAVSNVSGTGANLRLRTLSNA